MADARCIHRNQRFLVWCFLFFLTFSISESADEQSATCGTTIDLSRTDTNIYSGVIKVDMPTDFSRYQGSTPVKDYCDITIMFGSGVHLQLELYYLDIMPQSYTDGVCSTGLEVFDRSSQIYATRLCMEGWEWEEQHREKQQEKKVAENTPLTFRLISEGPYRGSGFKVHFNLFRPVWPCYPREFKCERLQRCIHDDITCDGWDDCGDNSDETEDAGCELLTVSEIFAVIIAVFLLIGTVIATAVFFIKYRRIVKRDNLQRMESKLVLEEERRSMQEPVLSFPHRFNSMESMNKSHYSRNTGQKMDIESLMDRMEMDKVDKYSCKDNMSERSYKSKSERHRSHDNASDRYGPSSRKNRAASQSSLIKEKIGTVGTSNHGSRPDIDKDPSDKNSDRKDRASKEDDRESSRRRSKERRRYSDEEDDEYNSDRDRRRRRSRDRRRYDRSDDDDGEYDSDRDRRRRRSMERARRSDDEEDSDRERRRRRSRDRRRYNRSSDEDNDNSDSDRRRRRKSRDRYSDEEYDSDRGSSNRRRRSRDRRRYDRSSDEDYDDEKPRRNRSRDRRRYDTDENDSDRDRPRRRSRDKRRSKERSEDRDEKPPPYEEPREPVIKPGVEKQNFLEPAKRDKDPVDVNQRSYSQARDKPIPRANGSQPYKPRGPDARQEPDHHPRPKTPPKSEDLHNYNRENPKANIVAPVKDTNGQTWVPKSERKRNRRSRGDLNSRGDSPPSIYEDVVPKVQLENLGYHEETV